jgi:hypothetical protein
MGEPALPFGQRDAVVVDRRSRHFGLHVTAVAFADRTPRIRAWLHTPDWERIVATAAGPAAGVAALRAEDALDHARARGVPVALPRLRRVDAA